MKYENNKIIYEVGDYVVQLEKFMIFPTDFKPHKISRIVSEDCFYLEENADFTFPFISA